MADQVQLGRLDPVDRPGLASWSVADTTERDALTKIGTLDIAEADIGRVCRVGSAKPYQYFELVGVSPLAWAEFGAKGEPGADGADGADGDPGADAAFTEDAPADSKIYGRKDGDWAEVPAAGGGGSASPRKFQVSFYVPEISSEDDQLLATYVVPPIDGGIVFDPTSGGGISAYACNVPADDPGSVLQVFLNGNSPYNGSIVATSEAPFYAPDDNTIPKAFTAYAGDVLSLGLSAETIFDGSKGITDYTLTLVGTYDETLTGQSAGPVVEREMSPGYLALSLVTTTDQAAGVIAMFDEGADTAVGVKMGLYAQVDDGDGNIVPGALIDSFSGNVQALQGMKVGYWTLDDPAVAPAGDYFVGVMVDTSVIAKSRPGNAVFSQTLTFSDALADYDSAKTAGAVAPAAGVVAQGQGATTVAY